MDLIGINRKSAFLLIAFKWIGFKHSGFKSAMGVKPISFKWMGFKPIGFKWMCIKLNAFIWKCIKTIGFKWMCIKLNAFNWIAFKLIAFKWMGIKWLHHLHFQDLHCLYEILHNLMPKLSHFLTKNRANDGFSGRHSFPIHFLMSWPRKLLKVYSERWLNKLSWHNQNEAVVYMKFSTIWCQSWVIF